MHISVIKLTKYGLLELGKCMLFGNEDSDVVSKHRSLLLNSSVKHMNILIVARCAGADIHCLIFKSSRLGYIYIISGRHDKWYSKFLTNESRTSYPSIPITNETTKTLINKLFNWECLVIAEPDRAEAIYDKLKGDPRDYTLEELEDVCGSLSLLDASHYLTMDTYIRP